MVGSRQPEAIGWLLSDETGAVRLIDPQGREVPCKLDGQLPPSGAAEVILSVDGATRRVTVMRPPRLEDIFVVVDRQALGGHSGAALETLVNQIAHDIRNYAFAIGLQAEMGQRGAPTPEGRRHLEAVLRQVDGLKRYLDQLLLYGRPARLAPQSLEVESFLREEIQRFQFSWDSSAPPLDVRLVVGELPRTVTWDRRAVGIVLATLLDNAARSAVPPPPITVAATLRAAEVLIEVRDAGPGMAPETIAALATPMKIRRAGAAGLGLAIARKLARAHGGEFELHSGADGTTAAIALPLEVSAG